MSSNRIKVLVVDDSALIRNLLVNGLNQYPFIEVVGSAPDPFIAQDKLLKYDPDVLTLDVEMPRMDGLTYLKNVMNEHPMPVIMVSSLTRNGCEMTLNCLEAGAVDFVTKPPNVSSLQKSIEELADKIKFASKIRVRTAKKTQDVQAISFPSGFQAGTGHSQAVIAVGASTGGTEALREILVRMPANSPAMIVVQHMPEKFTHSFARRLNNLSKLEVREVRNGDSLFPGLVLIAPGDYHVSLRKNGNGYFVETFQDNPVNGHRPSVDVLFESVAKYAGKKAVGVLLTGMGKDGAEGLLAMKKQGAYTIAQDETSCVIFGMPREAIRIGAADKVAPLDQIPQEIVDAFTESR